MVRLLPYIWTVSGIFFGAAFVHPYLFWCVLPGIALFVYATQREATYMRAFVWGTCAGSLHYAGAFFWIWSLQSVSWIPPEQVITQSALVFLYWVSSSLLLGFISGISALIFKRVLAVGHVLVCAIPILWVAFDLLKSLILSVFLLGEGSFVHFGLSFGYVGYPLVHYGAFSELARIAGVYGLTLVCVSMGSFLYLSWVRGWFKQRPFVFSVVCIALIPFLLPFVFGGQQEVSDTDVYVVETYFGNDFFTEQGLTRKQEEIMKATQHALQQGARTIILPEDASLMGSFSDAESLFDWIQMYGASESVLIVDNGMSKDYRGMDVIRSNVYDSASRSVYVADKTYLVPQGEYISSVYTSLFSLFISKEQYGEIMRHTRSRVGSTDTVQSAPSHIPGLLFCFESVVPYAVFEERSKRDMPFIAHSISHSWFADSLTLQYQLDAMLRVHAIWNGVSIVSAAQQGKSNAYIPNGAILHGEIVEETEHWILKRFVF